MGLGRVIWAMVSPSSLPPTDTCDTAATPAVPLRVGHSSSRETGGHSLITYISVSKRKSAFKVFSAPNLKILSQLLCPWAKYLVGRFVFSLIYLFTLHLDHSPLSSTLPIPTLTNLSPHYS